MKVGYYIYTCTLYKIVISYTHVYRVIYTLYMQMKSSSFLPSAQDKLVSKSPLHEML